MHSSVANVENRFESVNKECAKTGIMLEIVKIQINKYPNVIEIVCMNGESWKEFHGVRSVSSVTDSRENEHACYSVRVTL